MSNWLGRILLAVLMVLLPAAVDAGGSRYFNGSETDAMWLGGGDTDEDGHFCSNGSQGKGGYIICIDNAVFTMSIWVKLTATPVGTDYLATQYTGVESSGRKWLLFTSGSKIIGFNVYYGSNTGNNHWESTTALTVNRWHHITITYNGTLDTNNGKDRGEIYLDGVLDTNDSNSTNSGTLSYMTGSNTCFAFGAMIYHQIPEQDCSTGTRQDPFTGNLAHFQLWKATLHHPQRVQAMYCPGSVGEYLEIYHPMTSSDTYPMKNDNFSTGWQTASKMQIQSGGAAISDDGPPIMAFCPEGM